MFYKFFKFKFKFMMGFMAFLVALAIGIFMLGYFGFNSSITTEEPELQGSVHM